MQIIEELNNEVQGREGWRKWFKNKCRQSKKKNGGFGNRELDASEEQIVDTLYMIWMISSHGPSFGNLKT